MTKRAHTHVRVAALSRPGSLARRSARSHPQCGRCGGGCFCKCSFCPTKCRLNGSCFPIVCVLARARNAIDPSPLSARPHFPALSSLSELHDGRCSRPFSISAPSRSDPGVFRTAKLAESPRATHSCRPLRALQRLKSRKKTGDATHSCPLKSRNPLAERRSLSVCKFVVLHTHNTTTQTQHSPPCF
jgi:hypothetical protein